MLHLCLQHAVLYLLLSQLGIHTPLISASHEHHHNDSVVHIPVIPNHTRAAPEWNISVDCAQRTREIVTFRARLKKAVDEQNKFDVAMSTFRFIGAFIEFVAGKTVIGDTIIFLGTALVDTLEQRHILSPNRFGRETAERLQQEIFTNALTTKQVSRQLRAIYVDVSRQMADIQQHLCQVQFQQPLNELLLTKKEIEREYLLELSHIDRAEQFWFQFRANHQEKLRRYLEKFDTAINSWMSQLKYWVRSMIPAEHNKKLDIARTVVSGLYHVLDFYPVFLECLARFGLRMSQFWNDRPQFIVDTVKESPRLLLRDMNLPLEQLFVTLLCEVDDENQEFGAHWNLIIAAILENDNWDMFEALAIELDPRNSRRMSVRFQSVYVTFLPLVATDITHRQRYHNDGWRVLAAYTAESIHRTLTNLHMDRFIFNDEWQRVPECVVLNDLMDHLIHIYAETVVCNCQLAKNTRDEFHAFMDNLYTQWECGVKKFVLHFWGNAFVEESNASVIIKQYVNNSINWNKIFHQVIEPARSESVFQFKSQRYPRLEDVNIQHPSRSFSARANYQVGRRKADKWAHGDVIPHEESLYVQHIEGYSKYIVDTKYFIACARNLYTKLTPHLRRETGIHITLNKVAMKEIMKEMKRTQSVQRNQTMPRRRRRLCILM